MFRQDVHVEELRCHSARHFDLLSSPFFFLSPLIDFRSLLCQKYQSEPSIVS